jgi:predicted RNase H-like HicB family nuclease
MESYHTQKSAEEAEERYKEAIKYFVYEYLELGLEMKDFPQTIKALMIASGKK